MSTPLYTPGKDSVEQRGWLVTNKWLILRRLSQFGIVGLFLIGPITLWNLVRKAEEARSMMPDNTAGFWPVKGTLASSLTLDVLPLTDPFMALQALLAGFPLAQDAWIGAAIVVVAYLVFGGRSYCSWVCPINVVSDAAHWVRQKLGLKGGVRTSRKTRYWVMGMVLAVSAITGTIAWELINPITIAYRGILFGVGLTWTVVLAVFLYDLFVARRGWCSHLCPVGAAYSVIGLTSVLRVSAKKRSACNNCMDCFAVCPEAHVITPALRGAEKGVGPVILSPNCTNCGRCIDVCAPEVFNFTTRFDARVEGDESQENSPEVPRVAA